MTVELIFAGLLTGDGMTGIANHAKRCQHEQFGDSVRSVSDSICGLVEAAGQAAYLLAVSEPSSVAAKQGLVDQAQFARAYQAIQGACASLSSPTSNQQQVSIKIMSHEVCKYTSFASF